jgi:putative ABC transport system substrate-binding protein
MMDHKKSIQSRIPVHIYAVIVLFVLILGGCADKTHKVYRVGILSCTDTFNDIAHGFKSRMAELGYREGKNILYNCQDSYNSPESKKKIIIKFIEENIDLIFAYPAESSVIAKEATRGTDIPVVFCIAGIEGNNLIESVRRPGGNITGVRYPGPDLVCKRLEILLELAPHIHRIYVPYDPMYPNNPPALHALRMNASVLGITLVESPVSSVEDIKTNLNARKESGTIGIEAIQILPEILTQSPAGWAVIRQFAEEYQLPLVGSVLSSADRGGVFSYCVDFFEVGALAAPLADKILKGTQAGTIAVVTPETHLRLNYKIIKKLGLKADEGLLSIADEIIR